MTTHELETGQTVMVAVVPRDATDVHLDSFTNSEYECGLYYNIANIQHEVPLAGLLDDYSLIGTIQHPGVCSFDTEPFVKTVMPRGKFMKAYTDYINSNRCLVSAQDSFLSRLASWGYYWDNPLGPTCPQMAYFTDTEAQFNDGHAAMEAWQEAESRKLSVEQMVVLILIKK